MANTYYNIRYVARIVMETLSPLAIGSGEKNILTDSPVLRDVNGLPFIPGTSLAGVIRHALTPGKRLNELMGWQKGTQGEGSRFIVSDAKIMDGKSCVVDGLRTEPWDELLTEYRTLPIRQHTRIGLRGSTQTHGKFDEEVVFTGTRFCFHMELVAEADSYEADFLAIIDTIHSAPFRIGSGSRSGFGKVRLVSAQYRKLNLTKPADWECYLGKSSDLNAPLEGFLPYAPQAIEQPNIDQYQIVLHPIDFLMIGSGMGDSDADRVYVSEKLIRWEQDKASVLEGNRTLLLPASSLKGALSHRTAYHYNKQHGIYADALPPGADPNDYTGKNNPAVASLFGSEGDRNGNGMRRGNVLFTDILLQRRGHSQDQVFNHVKIDRFTGGGIDGALFSEKATYVPEEVITFDVLLYIENLPNAREAVGAFECALKDLCSGMLSLGGNVNKGYGRFQGSMSKNGITIYEYNKH